MATKNGIYHLTVPVSLDLRYKLKIDAANQRITVQKLINNILERALSNVITKTIDD